MFNIYETPCTTDLLQGTFEILLCFEQGLITDVDLFTRNFRVKQSTLSKVGHS